jgi:hypothetical protein
MVLAMEMLSIQLKLGDEGIGLCLKYISLVESYGSVLSLPSRDCSSVCYESALRAQQAANADATANANANVPGD